MASVMISALRRSSAYIFLRRWFSSSSSLRRAMSEASIPPEFGTPLVEGGRADAMLAAKLRDGSAGLDLFEDGDDLGIAKA